MLNVGATAAMSNMWLKTPPLYQLKAITTLLEMLCKDNNPSSTLLIQRTRRGISTVPHTVGFVTCDFTLIIKNTLLLGGNQKSKFENANQDNGLVQAFQLDSIKSQSETESKKYFLMNLHNNKNAFIFIFTLPEQLFILSWNTILVYLPRNKF